MGPFVPRRSQQLLGLYFLTGVVTSIFFVVFAYVTLIAIWFGNADILWPIKSSFFVGFTLFLIHVLYPVYTSLRDRKWFELVLSIIGVSMLFGFLGAFLQVANEFVFLTQFTFNLTNQGSDVRILSTIGLVPVLIFVLLSIANMVKQIRSDSISGQ